MALGQKKNIDVSLSYAAFINCNCMINCQNAGLTWPDNQALHCVKNPDYLALFIFVK